MSARAKPVVKWESEAAMVAASRRQWRSLDARPIDTAGRVLRPGPDTLRRRAGDLLLVREDGLQLGVEAKLTLNVDVLLQALGRGRGGVGPDLRAILVPSYAAQNGVGELAWRLGITVVRAEPPTPGHDKAYDFGGGERTYKVEATPAKFEPSLPNLKKRGWVTRADFKALGIDMSRWTQAPSWLSPVRGATRTLAGLHAHAGFRAPAPRELRTDRSRLRQVGAEGGLRPSGRSGMRVSSRSGPIYVELRSRGAPLGGARGQRFPDLLATLGQVVELIGDLANCCARVQRAQGELPRFEGAHQSLFKNTKQPHSFRVVEILYREVSQSGKWDLPNRGRQYKARIPRRAGVTKPISRSLHVARRVCCECNGNVEETGPLRPSFVYARRERNTERCDRRQGRRACLQIRAQRRMLFEEAERARSVTGLNNDSLDGPQHGSILTRVASDPRRSTGAA